MYCCSLLLLTKRYLLLFTSKMTVVLLFEITKGERFKKICLTGLTA